MRSMVTVVPQLSGYGAVLHVYVSVPLVPQLLDGVKYMEQRPPRETRDLRRMRQTPRGPNMRTLVKLALVCDSAEQMGAQLRRRFERNARRAASPNLDGRAPSKSW